MLSKSFTSGSLPKIMLLLALLPFTLSATPPFINYQGVLNDIAGNPLAGGSFTITFKIYNDISAGTELWTETQTNVTTNTKGLFHVQLGSVNPLSEDVFVESNLWLGITIVTEPPQSEMSPRSPLGSVPYAFIAGTVQDKAITNEKLADKAVGQGQLDDKAVGRGQLDDKAVGQGQLDDKAVGRGQLGDKAVGQGQIDDKAVGRGHIDDKAVGHGQLDDDAVTTENIVNGTILFEDINQNEATDGQVMKWFDNPVPGWVPADDNTDASTTVLWYKENDVLYTEDAFGISRRYNTLIGTLKNTHINFGSYCTTGKLPENIESATIGGGRDNTASGDFSTIPGGKYNTADGNYSIVLGGYKNNAEGDFSIAAGILAKAKHHGCIVLSANNETMDISDSVWTQRKEQIVLRADSGFYLTDRKGAPDNNPNQWLKTSTGAHLTATGIWQDNSDVNTKENFMEIDRRELLEKLAALSITRWNFKIDSDDIGHIGPTAQDFYAAFGLGYDDKSIATVDEAGIALAAVQELYKKTKQIDELEAKVAALEKQIEKLLSQNR